MSTSTLTSDQFTGINIFQNSFPEAELSGPLTKPQWQNQYAIIWLKKGQGSYYIDFREYSFQADTLIVISKNQDVSFDLLEGSEFTSLTFTQETVSGVDEHVQELLSFCIREHFQGKQILQLSPKDSDYLGGLTEQLKTVLNEWEGNIRKDSAFHLLQLFLLYCAHLSQQQAIDIGYAHDEVVSDFTALLEQNFKNIHKVSYYTDQLNLTYNSLARFTGQYCDKSPKEIITERIILEIKRLLSSTRLSVKEVAYELGFDEPTNMVKFFRKSTGITPTAFRKEGEFSPFNEEKSPLSALV